MMGSKIEAATRDRNSREVIVVAVDGTKDLTRHALEWSYIHVAQPHDHVILLAIIPGWKKWDFWNLQGQCSMRPSSRRMRDHKDIEDTVNELFSSMMQQRTQKGFDAARQVQFTWEVVTAPCRGATAKEAKRLCATWVVIDGNLQREAKLCLDELKCNVVIVKRSNPKILRLNLKQSAERNDLQRPSLKSSLTPCQDAVHRTPLSSPELVSTPFTATEVGSPSLSSSGPCSSSSLSPEFDSCEVSKNSSIATEQLGMKEVLVKHISNSSQFELSFHDAASKNALIGLKPNTNDPAGEFALSSLSCKKLSSELQSQETMRSRGANFRAHSRFRKIGRNESCRFFHLGSSSSFSMSDDETLTTEMGVPSQISAEWAASAQHTTSHPQRKMLCDFLSSKEAPYEQNQNLQFSRGKTRQSTKSHDSAVPATRHSSPDHDNLERVSSVRRAMLLSRDKPPGPPPLCSFCQHKSPVFGKPPKRFRFAELEVATGGFCDANFLAEGGFGSVHQGVLPNGQPVAVKQHKLASTQGDKEFCSEVEVLSCAQHRNLVMLIGYCIENKRRLLVYEFVCNGSLDLHLYGRNRPVLEWDARQKVAVGAARGLRYLHEECRVGCIVHRDMRPNNILLTHDYEAMVGDFGLARWQPNGEKGVETRVIGTFGYLAPEYTQTGQITEKADVYSFGVVLLELISGRKAIDISRPKGQQCLAEWARPLLEEQSYLQLLDPRLEHNINANELSCMLEAAALCITQDPQLRPKMSQVLHVLEGDNAIVSPKSSSSTGSSFELPFDATRNKIIVRETGNCNSYIVPKDNILHRNLGTLQRASYSGPLRPDQEACKRNTLRRLSMSNAEPLSGHHPGKISSEIKDYAEA